MRAPLYLAAVLIVGPLDRAPARADKLAERGAACAAYAPEAASRSGLTTEIVLRVMAAESGGNPQIVSFKGAMGCMQIMPATWAYLSSRYRLGADPYDPRQNMIAGTAYLAELRARYGIPGALAAYNAGPARYDRYLAGRAALPAETIAYAARIAHGSAALALPPVPRWQEAALFLNQAPSRTSDAPSSPAKDGSSHREGSLFPLAASVPTGDGASTRP